MDSCLLDTGVLIQLVSTASERHGAAVAAVTQALASGAAVTIAPQCIYEFWSVVTRPIEANGLGWTVARARSTVETFRSRFPILPEPPEVVEIWLDLVTARGLKGKRIHDAHLLATMAANGVSQLITFNAADFPAMDGIAILTPEL
jgi:predicted nucleic acid-binding protein